MYKAGQSGMLSTTSSVNKVMLGTPRFTLNEEGYPINKSFNTDAILDWGYYDGKNFNLKNGVADVRTTFVSQIKRNVPVVIFRIGNQNVAFPVNLVGMSSNNNINLLDILNDQSQPISKQVIKINETLLSKGLSGKFFYRGDSDQNVFKNVETQELSDDFVQAQRDLDSQNITPNMLDLDINGLAQSVLSPIDFSNNPLSSPRLSFELSNLGSNVVTREEVREVNPTTQEVEVKPNPSKVTQEANKEVAKVIKQRTLPTTSNEKITMKDRGNEVSYSVKPFDSNDTETLIEIRNILERGDLVYPKGSSGVYEYNGTSLVLVRGNGEFTFKDFSRGMEIYKSKFNSEKIQDKKDSIEADNSLVNRAKKEQNKKC